MANFTYHTPRNLLQLDLDIAGNCNVKVTKYVDDFLFEHIGGTRNYFYHFVNVCIDVIRRRLGQQLDYSYAEVVHFRRIVRERLVSPCDNSYMLGVTPNIYD